MLYTHLHNLNYLIIYKNKISICVIMYTLLVDQWGVQGFQLNPDTGFCCQLGTGVPRVFGWFSPQRRATALLFCAGLRTAGCGLLRCCCKGTGKKGAKAAVVV